MKKEEQYFSNEIRNAFISGTVALILSGIVAFFTEAGKASSISAFPTVDKWPSIIANIYNFAPIPFRFAYFGWFALLIVYAYADINDKVHFKLPRQVKEENFKQWTIFILVFLAGINHLFFQAPAVSMMPLYKIDSVSEVLCLILGYIFLFVGFIIVFVARSIINGYWGPHLYIYNKSEDNRLVNRGIYSKIRHPIYSGQILMAIATFILANNIIVIIFPLYMIVTNTIRANKEEKHLDEIFGEKYMIYKSVTGKWFPKIIANILPEE